MPLRAAFFDVGDTLVEHWAPGDVVNEKMRARIRAAMGEQKWLEEWLDAEIEPIGDVSLAQALATRGATEARFEPETARQETERWYRDWFEGRGIDLEGIDLDRLRSLMCVPLDEISTPVPGAFDALRWCVERGLRVVLVTNTLSRGDQETLEDWRRFGLHDAIHGVVSSHSAGWRKPHPAIFERALEIAGARPDEAFHVGDNLIADVWGARQLGIRAVWRRTPAKRAAEEADATEDPADEPETLRCRHNSAHLFIRNGEVCCRDCGRTAGVEVRPDATVDDLTELPGVVAPWLDAA